MSASRDFNQGCKRRVFVQIWMSRPLREELQDVQQSGKREAAEECIASRRSMARAHGVADGIAFAMSAHRT